MSTPPDIRTIVFLLFVAAIVAIVARRYKLPTSAGLFLAGALLSVIPGWTSTVGLSHETLFSILLPPLIFEGALNLRWRELRQDWSLVSALATFGVVIAAGIAAASMHFVLGWAWTPSLYFGVLIAATDPIAVLANFKELGVTGRPRMLVEAESLLNDGTAVVLFGLVAALGSHASAESVTGPLILTILRTVGGGIIAGLAMGWLMTLIAGRAVDPLTETTLTTVAAYGSYFLAETIGGTGILASVAAGLVMGNMGMRSQGYVSERGREVAEAFWDFAAFAANALVFLLMGLTIGRAHLSHHPLWIVGGVVFGLLSRAATVYGTSALFHRSSQSVPKLTQHMMFWGGQRGGLSLVLALSLVASGEAWADRVVIASTGVVAFATIVQGITFRPLMKRLGATVEPAEVSEDAPR